MVALVPSMHLSTNAESSHYGGLNSYIYAKPVITMSVLSLPFNVSDTAIANWNEWYTSLGDGGRGCHFAPITTTIPRTISAHIINPFWKLTVLFKSLFLSWI